ncbi:MAG TPA: glycerol-3-phosphate 1-O-acyltransferase PlsY, partial [Chloroflexota bacterium]|nr:glycerol-3-phosphate 1-O-acyltransferase PlsY [Chloroflexota bacterium]
MIAWPALLLIAAAGYLIGSIPNGYLIGRVLGVDPRTRGSGKTGASNVLRTMGPKASAAVLLCDMAKGAAAVALARLFFRDVLEAQVVAGVAAIIGHVLPVFIGFRGGRGVATALGAMLVISPLVGLVALISGLLIIARSKIASLGSLLGTGLALAVIAVLVASRLEPPLALVYCVLASLILA